MGISVESTNTPVSYAIVCKIFGWRSHLATYQRGYGVAGFRTDMEWLEAELLPVFGLLEISEIELSRQSRISMATVEHTLC
jgi:hypothetical protein